jgi:hypothetical protein
MFDSEKIAEEVESKVDEVKVEDAAAIADETKPVEAEDAEKLNRDKETVPLAAHIETKRMLSDTKRRLAELERQRNLDLAERAQTDIARKLEDLGYTPEAAKAEAEERYQSKRKLDQIEQRLLNSEILELSKSNEVYADAMTYKDDIRAKMQELDVDAEQAYLLVRGSSRMKEIATATEQRALAKRGATSDKRVESSSATSVKTPYNLSATDRKALKGLQEAQPDMGWTAEKYHKLFYGDSAPKE